MRQCMVYLGFKDRSVTCEMYHFKMSKSVMIPGDMSGYTVLCFPFSLLLVGREGRERKLASRDFYPSLF